MEVKRENYITVQGWMVTDLGLRGNELLLYALIYGFSQADDARFTGSVKYVTSWLGCSRRSAITYISNLCDAGLVEKTSEVINGVTFNYLGLS